MSKILIIGGWETGGILTLQSGMPGYFDDRRCG